jgi:hypothetical protein
MDGPLDLTEGEQKETKGQHKEVRLLPIHIRRRKRPINRAQIQIPLQEEAVQGQEQPVQEEPLQENEVFTYIIHGTMDSDESKIDNDEALDMRKKYIYDLRYWAWKRLNAELKEHHIPVQWDNVLAYNYRHSSDSIWAKMFAPPVYWSPVESLGEVVSKMNDAGLFGKYDFENAELTEANISIVRTIAKQIQEDKTVLLYGFSVGGLVVQRICEILNICVKNERLSQLILGLVLDYDKLERFKVATFGSIYISPIERVEYIDIMNYMMVDDVVTRTNLFEFGLGFTVPLSDEFEEEDGDIGYLLSGKDERLYQFMIYNESNLMFLEKWSTSWLFVNHKEEVPRKNFIQYKINELKSAFSKHNPKYDLLFNKLLKAHTYSLYDLQFIEHENAANIPEAAPVISAQPINVSIIQPEGTVEQLVQGTVTFTPEFYTEEKNYITEKSRRTRINNKLKEAKEAKRAYDEEQERLSLQEEQRNERARRRRGDEIITTQVDKGIRLRRRNAIKQIQEEINDISHHAADNILELHQKQEKPIILAEEPEQDMLDFSFILGQIEAKAMFLKGDGLVSFRLLTNEAIDRGKRNRGRIPEASSMEAAGGGIYTQPRK